MTVICALHEPGIGTWIASDTLVSWENETVGYAEKWIVKGGAALGLTGSSAVRAILADAVEFDAETAPFALSRKIIEALRAHDFKPKAEEGNTPFWDFSCLFATPFGVSSLGGCGSVVSRFPDDFAAKGSGANYAEGAAWALARQGKPPREVVADACAAAMAWDRACGGEIFVECLKQ